MVVNLMVVEVLLVVVGIEGSEISINYCRTQNLDIQGIMLVASNVARRQRAV